MITFSYLTKGRFNTPIKPGTDLAGYSQLNAPTLTGRDENPGISDQGAASGLSSYRIAKPVNDGVGILPGPAGTPISGTPVGLDHDPGGDRFSTTTTDANGSFNFTKLPSGKYKLTIAGQPSQSVTVGTGGMISGNVMSGAAGESGGTRVYRITNVRVNAKNTNAGESSAIWDRWGNSAVLPNSTPPTVVTGKDAEIYDRLHGSGIAGTPGSPGNFGGVGSGPGFGAMGPGAMGSGAGVPMHPHP